ncbi:uncharacterized protein EI90DRAFT_3060386 [Cantharellus anzutake]|uniref:uncharacterized protein n=1 Tax=Cantharellus anzutake TaxID=1750568 RepID=UPI001906A7D3|nr:uncharacterized protein EI90DRAFT_3060386 [Cantharellus anzutake]KAF8330342.1 hypothetical protein EI90DRAFT_3060386 [Cantharellus anzutake]
MATPRAPSSLSKVLTQLKKTPAPSLPAAIKSLKLTLARRNAHFGARHFLKEEVPRIAYVNPSLVIEVERKEKSKEEDWDPELVVQYADGSTHTINMQQKHSSKILAELLALNDAGPKRSRSSITV